MILFGLLPAEEQIAMKIRRHQRSRSPVIIERTEILLQQLYDAVVKVARHTDHGIFNCILSLHISPKIIRCHRFKPFLQPQDGIG
ncbi:hypothetical protein D3C71_1562380 [compost metagenome]